MPTSDVLVVGGGVIGCAIAFEIAKTGAEVTVLERDEVGAHASGAAAGMLSPLAEAKGPGPAFDLGIASLKLYPSLAEELRERSGIDIEYDKPGLLRVAFTEEEAQELTKHLAWQEEAGFRVSWLTRRELLELEPAFTTEVSGSILSLDEPHVTSPRLVRALAQAATRLGATICQAEGAVSLLSKGERVVGVRTDRQDHRADWVVLATGSWTALWGGQLHWDLPIRPFRGQILSVQSVPQPIQRVVFTRRGYLVPKRDGSILVGATEEDVGFDERVTTGGIGGLLSAAPTIVPKLGGAAFQRAWAGLRPWTPDGLPILGPVPGWQGLVVAAGHHRKGILLAPITGKLVAELITNGQASIPLEPFSPARFRQTSG